MNLDYITQKLKSIENEAQQTIAKNVELQAENEHLRELTKAHRGKLNNIYEASAKAQYEAELWQKRYGAIEAYIQEKLEITPASIPYDNVRLALNVIKRYDLHDFN